MSEPSASLSDKVENGTTYNCVNDDVDLFVEFPKLLTTNASSSRESLYRRIVVVYKTPIYAFSYVDFQSFYRVKTRYENEHLVSLSSLLSC